MGKDAFHFSQEKSDRPEKTCVALSCNNQYSLNQMENPLSQSSGLSYTIALISVG